MAFQFEAHLSNGEVYQQNPKDQSITTEGRNCFYDIMQRIDEVEVFGLFSDDCPETWAVDLRDGHFQHNGIPFQAGDPSLEVPVDEKRRLIYFKRHTHTVQLGTALPEELAHSITYHIGWQVTIDGKNYKQTISVQ